MNLSSKVRTAQQLQGGQHGGGSGGGTLRVYYRRVKDLNQKLVVIP